MKATEGREFTYGGSSIGWFSIKTGCFALEGWEESILQRTSMMVCSGYILNGGQVTPWTCGGERAMPTRF